MNNDRLKNSHYSYEQGSLTLADYPLGQLINKIETPCYIYSQKVLKHQYERFNNTAHKYLGGNFTVCYAVKANTHDLILKELSKLGAGADVVSQGELELALKHGIDPKKIVFSGVGKTPEEISYALTKGILSFNIESLEELQELSELACKENLKANYSLRLNPKVMAKTHKNISTGHKTHKFGIIQSDILKVLENDFPSLHFSGLSIHIGSQLLDLEATFEAFDVLLDTVKKSGREIEVLDVGGGLGISYDYENETSPNLDLYFETLSNKLGKHFGQNRPHVVFEPGRSIVGPVGMYLTKVLRTKTSEDCHFTIVDGGMNDFMRPSLYDAYHEIIPINEPKSNERISTDVVGPICETTDCFGSARLLPPLNRGDYIAIADAGAYGASMRSNYNLRGELKEYYLKEDGVLVR